MLFEVLTTGSMLGVLGASYYYKTNLNDDSDKILKIAENCGLYKKDEKMRLYRRNYNKAKKYTEYVYKIPLGLELQDFLDKYGKFKDGLNNRSVRRINLKEFRKLRITRSLPKQLRAIINNRVLLNKEIEMEYDGMLIVRVYDEGLTKELLYDDDMLAKVKNWQVPVGVTYKEFVVHDFEKLQMLVEAGMTRYGKTVFLKNAITTLINNEPDNVKFTLIDLKGGLAFSRFMACKQVQTVAKNGEETLEALEAIHDDLIKRQAYFLANGWEDIGEAGWKERHFIVVDEGAEIAGFEEKADRDRATHLLGEVARIGAGIGYRLIFATQYPTADVFPRQVKANTSAALCFKLKNSTQSMVVLDRCGAESLPTGLRGRAIYQTDCDRIVQTPLISNKFIDIKIKPHIVFQARKEDASVPHGKEPTKTGGSYITRFEETGLSDTKPDSANPQFKK
ncbi:cell division protein FtsK [Bacillus sp. ISL-40]|uniref:FtsK/SpoIIIE domain-containing protein n=1 Tax=unclassified Bacillus (in: firmicutes) TaxID=185979 RepID=UPI001BEB262C|nr:MULTISPECIES: FtsK/SpoIIIE domain-containing protein [unclassified Bacillus (in: firmicutes)]MBT2701579.1 cell division protein FtsK [Bacillus sp. ISL-40]MBT2722651.1 cell division protein FtsK [Bacillus sp. ISL-46]MBT2743344.1 cell division protein FtsK [Bacillus sp. ISL-77]